MAKLLDEINLEELFNVIKTKYIPANTFNGDFKYLNFFLKRRDVWDNLDRISVEDVDCIVLRFLNEWKCRIPYSCNKTLQKALQTSHDKFELIRSENLKSIEFEKIIKHDGRNVKIGNLVEEIFNTLSSVRAGRRTVGYTATTKIMHMVMPELFVMCDKAIREGYGIGDNSRSYLNFLIRMQNATKKFMKETEFQLYKKLHNDERSFIKVLDEYNYAVLTLKR